MLNHVEKLLITDGLLIKLLKQEIDIEYNNIVNNKLLTECCNSFAKITITVDDYSIVIDYDLVFKKDKKKVKDEKEKNLLIERIKTYLPTRAFINPLKKRCSSITRYSKCIS
jgi:hypothetical protein